MKAGPDRAVVCERRCAVGLCRVNLGCRALLDNIALIAERLHAAGML